MVRKQIGKIETRRCDYSIEDVLCWGYEVKVKAKFEGHNTLDSFTAGPFKKPADAIEWAAKHERKLNERN